MSEIKDDSHNYCVYVHVNKINQKKYVGITSKPPEERWKKDGYGYKTQNFYYAIQKYGWGNFEHIILDTGLTYEEANAKEKEYIEKYDSCKNGYNCSYGGDGTNGFVWTQESKKRMVETRIKNESFKGKNNPAYGKSPKERLSPEMYKKWRESLITNYNFPANKIICINTGEIFDRVGKVAEKYNTSPKNVTNCIIKHQSLRIHFDDYHLYYVFDYYDENKEYNLIDYCYKYSKKSVICLETKEVFWTSNDAGQIMNIPGCSIARVCRKERKGINGYHFMYVKEYIDNGIPKDIEFEMNNKIICVTTGEIFNNEVEAGNKYNLSSSGIAKCCNGKSQYNGKIDNIPLIWQHYNDYLVSPKDINSIIKDNSIHCITTDQYFTSIKAAGEYLNICGNNIYSCCNGKYHYVGISENGEKLVWERYTHTLNDNIIFTA